MLLLSPLALIGLERWMKIGVGLAFRDFEQAQEWFFLFVVFLTRLYFVEMEE